MNADQQKGHFKVLVLPQRGTYAAYDWGYQGGNLLFRSLQGAVFGGGTEYLASPDAQWAANLLYESFYSNSSAFVKLLSITGVKYVVLEGDFNTTFYQLPAIALNKAILSNNSGLVLEKQFGQVLVYRNTSFSSMLYLPQSVLQVNATATAPEGILWEESNFSSGWTVEKWNAELTSFSVDSNEMSIILQSSGSYIAGSVLRSLPPIPTSVRDLIVRFRTNAAASMSVEIIGKTGAYYATPLSPPEYGLNNNLGPTTRAYELKLNYGTPVAIRIWISNNYANDFVGQLHIWLDDVKLVRSVGSPLDVISLLEKSTSSDPASFILRNDSATVNSTLRFTYRVNGSIILSTRHDPTMYDLELSIQGPVVLILSETYSNGWVASSNTQTVPVHFRIDGFANAWLIDGNGIVKVHLEFQSQRYVVYGAIGSGASVALTIVLFLRTRRKGNRILPLATHPLNRPIGVARVQGNNGSFLRARD
jgi:hypothetical protein